MTIAENILKNSEEPARLAKILYLSNQKCTTEIIDHKDGVTIKCFPDDSAVFIEHNGEVQPIIGLKKNEESGFFMKNIIDNFSNLKLLIKNKLTKKNTIKNMEYFPQFKWRVTNGDTIYIEEWKGAKPIHNCIDQMLEELQYRFRFCSTPLNKFTIKYIDNKKTVFQLIWNPEKTVGYFYITKIGNYPY